MIPPPPAAPGTDFAVVFDLVPSPYVLLDLDLVAVEAKTLPPSARRIP